MGREVFVGWCSLGTAAFVIFFSVCFLLATLFALSLFSWKSFLCVVAFCRCFSLCFFLGGRGGVLVAFFIVMFWSFLRLCILCGGRCFW